MMGKRSKNRIFAMVACTRSTRRTATFGRSSLGMTHVLLFFAATIVSPGVFSAGACMSCPSCPSCSSWLSCLSCLPEAHIPPCSELQQNVSPHSCCSPAGDSYDRHDNHASHASSAREAADCRCILAPKTASLAVIAARSSGRANDDHLADASSHLPAGSWAAATLALPVQPREAWQSSLIPTRPVRVLYGVWRD